MAISWGSYNGHLRVGIDHVISPSSPSHSDTTVDVTWKYYVDSDGWNFNDTQTLHEDCDGWAGTNDTFTNNSTGGSILVGTHKETYGISYSSGSKSASASLSGAYNGATPSHSVTVALPDRPVATPNNPTGVTAGSITTTSTSMSWTAPSDNGGASIDAYQLQLSTSSAFSSTVYNNSTLTGTTGHSVTGLSANTKYYTRVRAHNSAGWGSWSATGSFTTLSGVPSTPGTPTETARTQTSMTVGWSASSSNGGTALVYEVDLATNSTFTSGLVTATGLTTTSHQFTGLTAGTTYYFRVKATNSNGSSGWSATYSRATLASTTYADTGDYVTLVNNLASAVATKILHLGTFIARGKTAATTIANNTRTYFDPGTSIETCNLPDPPTYTGGSDNATIQINYPGTYLIEFEVGIPGNSSTQAIELNIYCNGNNTPLTTNPKGGVAIASPWNANVHGASQYASTVRRLEVGDTVGFSAYQTTGSSVSTQPLSSTSDLYMYCRVTMIGF